MSPLWVVKHLDVVEHIGLGLRSAAVDFSPDPLALQKLKKALGDSVVVTVPAPTQADDGVLQAHTLAKYAATFFRISHALELGA